MTPFQLLTVSVTAGAFALLPGLSLAQTTETPSATMLTAEDAIAIALEAQPGEIAEAELDTFKGSPAYDIEVVNAAGQEIEFKIDTETGEILNKWIDDDPSNDPAPDETEETSN